MLSPLLLWTIATFFLAAPRAEENPLDEPLFCSNPVEAICASKEPLDARYRDLKKNFEDAQRGPHHADDAILLSFKDAETKYFVPSFEETRTRLLATIGRDPALSPKDREEFRKTLQPVVFASLSEVNEVFTKLHSIKNKLPKKSMVKTLTPETLVSLKKSDFETMTSDEKTFVRLLLRTVILAAAQKTDCGENVPINAFAFGSEYGMPTVTMCLQSMILLQPLDVQTRYPILGMIFAHELGHQLDSREKPAAYEKYLACLKAEPDSILASSHPKERSWEVTADFWSAATLANTVRTRAELMKETPEQERERATRFVRTALRWLCDEPGDPSHPAGSARIGKIYGKDPGLRQILGCKPRPACGLGGRTAS